MSMPENKVANDSQAYSIYNLRTLPADLTSGLVVFLVALPLCLGIALASRPPGMESPPLLAGLITGMVAGILVAWLSGSHTSVSGPAAGLTAIVAAQIANLGTYEAFLLAVVIGGVIQIVMGLLRAGALSAFFPSSVIRGLLAAIGVILILKQVPHLLGHDKVNEGDASFNQTYAESEGDGSAKPLPVESDTSPKDAPKAPPAESATPESDAEDAKSTEKHNTFGEIYYMIVEGDMHLGAAVIGLSAVALLLVWARVPWLQSLPVPGALAAVLMGVAMNLLFADWGESWAISTNHLVDIPITQSAQEFFSYLRYPDFSAILEPKVYFAAVTIAIVASLETLLNLEAVDKLDHEKRHSPPSRELLAQGAGNIVAGLIGGLPMTSVIIRSSVNVNSGGKTKRSAFIHGLLLVVCVAFLPQYLNMIPLSALAAILVVTGFKLASPQLFMTMWREGRYQFLPFIITVLAIVFTDLLIGIIIGLGIALLFILNSNLRRPIKRILESHLDGDVMHIELANQVSFLNKASLDHAFNEAKTGSNVLIDARGTDYIDPDVLSLIRDFKDEVAPARGVRVSLRGFRQKYRLHDHIQYADYSTRELMDRITPEQALTILMDGNERFRAGEQIARDYTRQIDGTAGGQNPLAVILGCIDSRVPAEIIFDLGIGDIFSVRVAGNIIGTKSLGSVEYGVAVAGVKLVVVLGHTRCGAVNSSLDLLVAGKNAREATGCEHLGSVVAEVQQCVHTHEVNEFRSGTAEEKERMANSIAARNVMRTVEEITARSSVIRQAVAEERVMVVGLIYDLVTGEVRQLAHQGELGAASD